ncbi:unnamed protein product, partial [marine sediment metagenome]
AVADASTETYPWSVPDAIGSALRVKITDTTNSTVTDTSDGNFNIKGALELTSPNGTELWIVDESRNITWNRTGSIANVKLEYSVNGGGAYPNVITNSTDASTGSYGWTVPDAIGTQLRVRVTDTTNPTVVDTSDANFEIKGSLTLTSPNGNEEWLVDSSHPITWSKTGTFANVKLEYSTNSGSGYDNVIVTSTGAGAATGSYDWTVDDSISKDVRVRVTNADDSAVSDTSDADFKIMGSLTLTAPDGGVPWVVDESREIT